MFGGQPQMPKPLTKEELLADTDNPYENPVLGTDVPSWKLKAEKKKTNKNKLTTSDTYQG
tara:strand:+ start:606 stop:785 length:180 start_codon:yes stop_codon:yes gene_type:complete